MSHKKIAHKERHDHGNPNNYESNHIKHAIIISVSYNVSISHCADGHISSRGDRLCSLSILPCEDVFSISEGGVPRTTCKLELNFPTPECSEAYAGIEGLPMTPGLMTTLEQDFQKRALPAGGFAENPGGDFRPDATAWAVLALAAAGRENPLLAPARSRLQAVQMQDGRVPVSRQTPEAVWPTSLAMLAWGESAEHASARDRAITYLLETTGKHWPRQADSPVAHDTALRGWPWVTETHSWVEPTALAVLALRATGNGRHRRTREAVEMLLDRQIPGGGWNYGNTRVYGKNLHPMPDATGLTLQALAGFLPDSAVESSLIYLDALTSTLRTPYSLAWSILGLSAWERRPAAPERLISDCLDRQRVFGSYPTSHLCLLLLALSCPAGLNGPLMPLKGSEIG